MKQLTVDVAVLSRASRASKNNWLSSNRTVVVVVVTRPLPRDGGVAEDHGAPEAGKLRRAWTRGRKRKLPKSP